MKQFLFSSLLLSLLICYSGNSYAQDNEFAAKWRLNVSGGLGYLTSAEKNTVTATGFGETIDKIVKEMSNDLKNGIQGGADIHYLINKNVGLGIKYSFFTANGNLEKHLNVSGTSGFSNLALETKATDYVHFVGPSVHIRSFIGDSPFAYSLTLSGGYAHYRGELNLDGYFYDGYSMYPPKDFPFRTLSKGNTFGAFGGLGIEYLLNKNIALGFDIGYYYLSFNEVKVKTSKKETEEFVDKGDNNYSRLDFSLGLKIYF
ncbi:MAG: porin family protein [Dysgonamonadaceae bacterium]|jgi:outer membrane protein W|nr:porin family protein [Dysgonamonadaceae bacterium]